jgi:hypothetical protein
MTYDFLASELTEEAVIMTRNRAQINIIAPNLKINFTIIFSQVALAISVF